MKLVSIAPTIFFYVRGGDNFERLSENNDIFDRAMISGFSNFLQNRAGLSVNYSN
jgi:hypothetical protein